MKKIYIFMLAAASLLSACSMDQEPYGSLSDKTAIQNSTDLGRFRNQLYASLRSVTSGSWIYDSDLQMDEFHGLISNGNRGGEFSNALVTSSTDDIKSFFSSGYSVIATANELLAKGQELLDAKADSAALIQKYMGEAYFVRGYMYFWLADHFCQPYTQIDPTKAATGLQITTTYNPTADISTYPSRSTLEETYKQIEDDLNKAYEQVKANPEEQNAAYVSQDAVAALQARVALVKGDYQTALTKAKEVINSGRYTLTPIAGLTDLWTNDKGTEVIFRPFMSNTELGGSTGAEYISSDESSADYIPTYEVLSLYSEKDARFNVFFKLYENLDVEGTKYQAYVLNKFPGNPALRTNTTNNIMNMSKMLRLSELYLIAAEADARLNNLSEGAQYLNDLRKARITDYQAGSYASASALLSAVLTERRKELIGEGLRMSDLRRLGQGFTRYASHDENPALDNVVVKTGAAMTYAANDYRLTWPIPKDEMDANPNLKGQQNPGY